MSELIGAHNPAGKAVFLYFPDRDMKPGLQWNFYAFCIVLSTHSNIEYRAVILTLESPGRLVKTQMAGTHPRSIWFSGSGVVPRIRISKKFIGEADAGSWHHTLRTTGQVCLDNKLWAMLMLPNERWFHFLREGTCLWLGFVLLY